MLRIMRPGPVADLRWRSSRGGSGIEAQVSYECEQVGDSAQMKHLAAKAALAFRYRTGIQQ